MRLIDADDLYQKCIEIQLKKRNRYFDIDDVIKLIKKAPTIDILDKIRAEIMQLDYDIEDIDFDYNDIAQTEVVHTIYREEVLQIIDKYRGE